MMNPADFHVPDHLNWLERANCASEDAPYMFPLPTDTRGIDDAKAVCRRCPVATECLQQALDRNETDGIWGGTTPDERRLMKRAEARKRARDRKTANA